MKLLVTGGAGFIGSNYIRYVLRETDDEVVVYDALTYAGNLSTLKDVDDDPRYSFVKGDICDPGPLEAAMAGCDAVVHFAAESHVDRSIVGSDDFVNTNCFGTNIVMDTARRLEIRRVVHIGTDEVYGSVEVGSSQETDPLEPRSPYSASKAGSDLIALSYHHTHGLPVTVTRCTNNFGPYQYPEKAIPLFTTNLLEGGQVPLYGDGLNERDWLFVDDHCSGIDLVLHEGAPGEIYNIGAGNETPNRVLVDKLLALLGKDETSIDYVEDRLGHDRRYSVDIAKVEALGWSTRRELGKCHRELPDGQWRQSTRLFHTAGGPVTCTFGATSLWRWTSKPKTARLCLMPSLPIWPICVLPIRQTSILVCSRNNAIFGSWSPRSRRRASSRGFRSAPLSVLAVLRVC